MLRIEQPSERECHRHAPSVEGASARVGLEFVKAMWGCLFADIVAVPVPPPNPERLSASLPSFNRILEDSGAVAILTDYKFEILVKPCLAGSFLHC